MDKGILVYWDNSVEWIEFESDDLSSISSVKHSVDYYGGDTEYRYSINPEVNERKDGVLEVTIAYNHEENKHIGLGDVSWGVSKIFLKPGEYKGEAEWTDSNEPENSGSVSWVRLDSPLKSTTRRKITTKKLQREQDQFRKLLMIFDKKCVITGEDNNRVLEAAHIIPVSEGGADLPSNGVILRCDLHKLYDSGAFRFSKSGDVEIDTDACGGAYSQLLNGACLPEDTLTRVKRALTEKSK